ncbi:MAG: hypothetical protein KKI08_21210 [Armatimonadetes bacterium]|nr:hypothetical protein [Armatimonadota bacterium]
MYRRMLPLVAVCTGLLALTAAWGQEEIHRPPIVGAVPSTLVFLRPPTNPGVATKNFVVTNPGRDAVTIWPWTVKSWISTNLPSQFDLQPRGTRRATVSLDWNAVEPLTPLSGAAWTRMAELLRHMGVEVNERTQIHVASAAVALDPGSGRPITWVTVLAVETRQR